MISVKANNLLPADCAHRLVTELQGALDSCAVGAQRQLERSLRVSRRLLQAWEPARTQSPVPETKEENPNPGSQPGCIGCKIHQRYIQRATAPAKNYPECRLRLRGDKTHVRTQDQTTGYGPGLRDQQMAPSSACHATELFTLKEKGTLLQLPAAFQKAASQNSRLWAQLSSTRTNDSTDATRAAKTQFLHKLQMASGCSSHRPSATEVEAHAQSLRKACTLLRLHMQKELATALTDWMQEYQCLLTLEGLQTVVGQCLHRIQALQAAVTGKLPGVCLAEKPTQASLVCGGEVDSSWSPELLLYSSTKELQTLATLKLQVAMLDQQIHLEKVLMAELLPLINTQEPGGPPWMALCPATYSLFCEGGDRFLIVLRDDPAD